MVFLFFVFLDDSLGICCRLFRLCIALEIGKGVDSGERDTHTLNLILLSLLSLLMGRGRIQTQVF